jgi:hypothetical protein
LFESRFVLTALREAGDIPSSFYNCEVGDPHVYQHSER